MTRQGSRRRGGVGVRVDDGLVACVLEYDVVGGVLVFDAESSGHGRSMARRRWSDRMKFHILGLTPVVSC